MIVLSCEIFSCKLVNTEVQEGFLQIYRQKILQKNFFLQDFLVSIAEQKSYMKLYFLARFSCKYRRTKILHETLLSCKIFLYRRTKILHETLLSIFFLYRRTKILQETLLSCKILIP